MGIIPALILLCGTALGLPSFFTATLAVASMVMVGGGMMEDALADAADGLFGGHTKHRRLEILKDSRHGTYGVAALCLLLLLRVTALGSLAAVNPLAAASLWLAANVAGRSAALWLSVALPPARSDGAAASAGTLGIPQFRIGAALAVLLTFAFGAPFSSPLGVLVALVLLAFAIFGWSALCRRLVGGQTGDLVGAGASLGEVTMLTVLLIFV
jgi:adenosylcobinamide-GDP ribazoletransferase